MISVTASRSEYSFTPSTMAGNPIATSSSASQQYLRYCQHYQMRIKTEPHLQSAYSSVQMPVFSPENSGLLGFRGFSRIGANNLALHKFLPSAHFHSVAHRTSANNARLAAIFGGVRYNPFSALNNAARIRQLYPRWDSDTLAKSAGVSSD